MPVKTHLVESLIFAIEKREISFPHLPEIVHELSILRLRKPRKAMFSTARRPVITMTWLCLWRWQCLNLSEAGPALSFTERNSS